MFDVIIQKKGKLDTSHRYDLLPLLRSSPGGIQRELVVYDFPDAKVAIFSALPKKTRKQLVIPLFFFCIELDHSCYGSLTYRAETFGRIGLHTTVRERTIYSLRLISRTFINSDNRMRISSFME